MKQSFCCFCFSFARLKMQNFRNQRRFRFLERSREPDFLGLNDNGDFLPHVSPNKNYVILPSKNLT